MEEKKIYIYNGVIARDKTGMDHIGANYLEVGQGSVTAGSGEVLISILRPICRSMERDGGRRVEMWMWMLVNVEMIVF